MSLLARWRALAGENADALGEALIRDPTFVGYAIWFHDAVYEPGRPDNEQVSADWARQSLTHDPALAERVGRVIEQTKKHHEGDAEGDAALFLDMDIAILGEPWEVYCRYAAGIRREFSMYPDGAFAAGRWRFLEQQLEHPRTFRTDLYETERGETARANMRWELEEMRRGRMVRA